MIPPHSADLIKTAAERHAHEQFERAEKRRRDLAEQRSAANPPDVRIRTWENVHHLRMPADPTHPILDVIAVGTRLTLAEVLQEQRNRVSGAVNEASTPAELTGMGPIT